MVSIRYRRKREVVHSRDSRRKTSWRTVDREALPRGDTGSGRSIGVLKTVVLGPPPAELQSLIDRRHALGIDLFDEMWEGSFHLAPPLSAAHAFLENVLAVRLHPYAEAAGLTGTGPFNLGRADDYRVPDRGYHQGQPRGTWVATAAIVVEIISPDDETYEKFGFYAACGVKEIFLADPSARSFTISGLTPNGTYEEAARSALLAIGAADLAAGISWPEETPS